MSGVRCNSALSVVIQLAIILLGTSVQLCGNLLIPGSIGDAFETVDITTELLQDGTFTNGVANWQSSGTVPNVTDQVILWDSVYPSGLWQPVPVGDAYSLTLSFRLRYDLLSGIFNTGTFPDFFVASIEFSNDPSAFSIFGGGVDATTLGSVDALSGLRDLAQGLSVEPDPSEPQWQIITFVTEPVGLYVTPFFRLFDENMVAGDSRIILSDISLTAQMVPEPGFVALWLGLAGLSYALITRRIKHR